MLLRRASRTETDPIPMADHHSATRPASRRVAQPPAHDTDVAGVPPSWPAPPPLGLDAGTVDIVDGQRLGLAGRDPRHALEVRARQRLVAIETPRRSQARHRRYGTRPRSRPRGPLRRTGRRGERRRDGRHGKPRPPSASPLRHPPHPHVLGRARWYQDFDAARRRHRRHRRARQRSRGRRCDHGPSLAFPPFVQPPQDRVPVHRRAERQRDTCQRLTPSVAWVATRSRRQSRPWPRRCRYDSSTCDCRPLWAGGRPTWAPASP